MQVVIGIDHDALLAGVVYAGTHHSTSVSAGRGAAASTNVQFLFHQENEATNSVKPSDDNPPCRNVLASKVTVMMKASISAASE